MGFLVNCSYHHDYFLRVYCYTYCYYSTIVCVAFSLEELGFRIWYFCLHLGYFASPKLWVWFGVSGSVLGAVLLFSSLWCVGFSPREHSGAPRPERFDPSPSVAQETSFTFAATVRRDVGGALQLDSVKGSFVDREEVG